jgi:hypothetical protein
MSVTKYAHDDVKSSTEWPARAVLAVATQCAPDCLRISAVLDCDREYNRAVASRAIGRAVALVIVQKKLADFPIGKAANRCSITEALNLEFEAFGGPTVRQAITTSHRRTLARSAAQTHHRRSTIGSGLLRRRNKQSYSPSHFSSVTSTDILPSPQRESLRHDRGNGDPAAGVDARRKNSFAGFLVGYFESDFRCLRGLGKIPADAFVGFLVGYG